MKGNKLRAGRIKLPWWLSVGGKAFISSLALQETALTVLEWDYYVDIPIVKYFFAIFQDISGWGMDVIFLMTGLACIFYLVRNHSLHKNKWLRGISLFFAVCMVFGRSYYETGSWNYIFHGKLQFGLACFVTAGYYWLFHNTIILGKAAVDKFELMEKRPGRGIWQWLFFRHPFAGPLCVIAVCGIPVMISFFPGTLQWDAFEQFCTYVGTFEPWTAHHPVPVTWLLGQCLYLSRVLFHNDSIALFLYAGPQYVIQWMVFAYGICLLNKLKTPILLRGGILLYFALFPLWRIWGFTVVKDSLYYIFLLLLVLLLVHILTEQKVFWWQWGLICISSIFVTHTRNNGAYVLVLFCISLLLLYRKYWRVCILVVCSVFLSVYAVNAFYIVPKNIAPGQTGEMLSIPLQQTARYIREHYEDITEEEMEVLSHMFSVDPRQVGELYLSEISDPVKEKFIANPTGQELAQYFQVWFSQLKKHPDTYIQALLNHIYGYFYPDRETFVEGIGRYYLGNTQHIKALSLDMKFYMEYKELRDMIEQEAHYMYRMPLLGMLYSCGFHNYILIGCAVYLLANRKYKELVILVPSLLTVLVCLVSPVDAYIRYMLPVMAAMPVNIAWCLHAVKGSSLDRKGQSPEVV